MKTLKLIVHFDVVGIVILEGEECKSSLGASRKGFVSQLRASRLIERCESLRLDHKG